MEAKLLVIDDDKLNRVLLSTNLQEAGYLVETAENGKQALQMLQSKPFDAVLLDLMMPVMDGFQVLKTMQGDDELRNIPVIVISASEDIDSVVRCIEMGATDHLTKPFEPTLLYARINASLSTKKLHDQEKTHRKEIEKHNSQLESRVLEQTKHLRNVVEGVVNALSGVVEIRDPYTSGHQKRVSELATAIAKEMLLPSRQIEEGIRIGGILHDIGKICVPAEILSKPGKISNMEFAIISEHARVGYDILKNIEFSQPIAQMVFQHHERMDGTGYPSKLSGDNILLEARILGVADVVEAMSYHRPYRPALGTAKAMEEITNNRSIRYDPSAVDACLILFQKKDFKFSTVW